MLTNSIHDAGTPGVGVYRVCPQVSSPKAACVISIAAVLGLLSHIPWSTDMQLSVSVRYSKRPALQFWHGDAVSLGSSAVDLE